ncbi:thioredoxin [Panacibacter ginsenosidivorans]|uniref:Thioredoxin n=1 Tax=Panacibacter ginsenosidivorans TaxID=1813871 RepID=A0A5B8VAC2_9BACT|nr:thioredoxin [Panacibacter ginsenosidivorans]QEC68394.1 thioredoxin [Panacibacter ginsenosidivorans]
MATSVNETYSEIINGTTPVLVDFSAEWCGPCKMMAPILKELHGMLGSAVRILKIDVDRNPKLAAQYNISGVPTLILFQSGKVLWRQSGVMPANQLVKVIKQHAVLAA